MTHVEEFYLERDRRTCEYGIHDRLDAPVGVVVGEDAANKPGGQLAVLSLVNMLARLHRRLALHVPSTPLLRSSLVPADRLDDAAEALARTIDPFIKLEHGTSWSCGIGLGSHPRISAPWYAGNNGDVALIDRHPLPFDSVNGPSLGAALAACLGAGNLLLQVLGNTQRPSRVSAWDLSEGDDARLGPEILGPLDVGNVMQIGAGGVGSCLAYWLREFGVRGQWSIVDGDLVELHNANRCLGLFPHHAGWAGAGVSNKADAAASLFEAQAKPVWFDEIDQDSYQVDLLLPLANERQVRHAIACRGEPFIIHATTSRIWEAQLHRHIPDRDDCIQCRMPGPQEQAQFACSTAKLETQDARSADAALPFLSAGAGLVLLSGLYRLQFGDLQEGKHNLWALCFRDARRHARRAVHRCHPGCAVTLPRAARLKVHQAERWSHVDSGADVRA